MSNISEHEGGGGAAFHHLLSESRGAFVGKVAAARGDAGDSVLASGRVQLSYWRWAAPAGTPLSTAAAAAVFARDLQDSTAALVTWRGRKIHNYLLGLLGIAVDVAVSTPLLQLLHLLPVRARLPGLSTVSSA